MTVGLVMDPWGTKEWPLKMWPSCGKCSKERQRRYVVEVFGFVARERSKTLKGKYCLVFEVGCHDQQDHFRLPIEAWWTDGKIMEMVARCICFNSRRNALASEEDGSIGFVRQRSLQRTDWADLKRQTVRELLTRGR